MRPLYFGRMLGTWLKAPALDAYGQMAFDETLLESPEGDPLVLRFYEWPGGPRELGRPHAATIGLLQSYEEAVRGLAARGLPVTFPIVRRPTAGGLVIHDQDLTFSLIFAWSRLASPSLVYKDLHRGIHLGLKSFGIASRLWSPGAAAQGRVVDCFAEPSPMDLVHEDGRKFLGGALRRHKGVGLYQGSLRPEGFAVPIERLKKAIVDGLSLEWQASFMPAEADENTILEAEKRRGERYVTDAWNKRI